MNYKIEVNNEAESKEVQGLFGSLGLTMNGWSAFAFPKYIANFVDGEFSDYSVYDGGLRDWKEITIPKLRDLVVLKRNDVGDASHISEDGTCKYYLSSDRELYFYLDNIGWYGYATNTKHDDLKPIEKPMKEYLNKLTDGTYKLVVLSDVIDGHDGLIEIPEGAIKATLCNDFLIFWKDDFLSLSAKNGDTDFTFEEDEDYGFVEYMDINDDAVVIWQRHSQSEELPFVDDESLNDQYAEIEQVRQNTVQNTLNERESTYGSFTGVANTTGQLMGVLLNSKNGQTLPYVHQEALHMICSKMARIVNGDHNHKDSWHDIAGYATLVERSL